MIVHLVLFSPKPELAPEKQELLLKAVSQAFEGIPSIRRSVVGERLDLGYEYAALGEKTYDYAATIEFDDLDGLRAYLQHPLHEDLARAFWECCGRTLILDVSARPMGVSS